MVEGSFGYAPFKDSTSHMFCMSGLVCDCVLRTRKEEEGVKLRRTVLEICERVAIKTVCDAIVINHTKVKPGYETLPVVWVEHEHEMLGFHVFGFRRRLVERADQPNIVSNYDVCWINPNEKLVEGERAASIFR